MLISNPILKVRGFLNAELAEKHFPGIAVMLFPIRFALDGKKCVRGVFFLHEIRIKMKNTIPLTQTFDGVAIHKNWRYFYSLISHNNGFIPQNKAASQYNAVHGCTLAVYTMA